MSSNDLYDLLNSSPRLFDRPLIKQLREDCCALGVSRPIHPRILFGLTRRVEIQQWARLFLRGLLFTLLWTVPFFIIRGIVIFLTPSIPWFVYVGGASDGDYEALIYPAWLEIPRGGAWGNVISIASVAVFAVFLIWGLLGLWGELLIKSDGGSRLLGLLLVRRYVLVQECAEAIHACAVSQLGGEGQPARVREISKRLNAVRRAVLNAHRSRGTVPRLSHRRRPIKVHEQYVTAALQDVEAKLDRSPDDARREITEALLTIAERYCEGRIGDLLDEEQLTGVPRQRNLDWLRYLIALGLAAGGITGLATTGVVPEGAQTYVYGIVLMVAFIVAFGRNFRRASDVINVITSGP